MPPTTLHDVLAQCPELFASLLSLGCAARLMRVDREMLRLVREDSTLWLQHGLRVGYARSSLAHKGVLRRVREGACEVQGVRRRAARWHRSTHGGGPVAVCVACTSDRGGYRALWTRAEAAQYASPFPRLLIRMALARCVVARVASPGNRHLLWPHDVRAQLARVQHERAARVARRLAAGRAMAKQRDLVGLFRRRGASRRLDDG